MHAYGLSVYLVWRNVYFGLLPIVLLGGFVVDFMSCLYILEIKPFQLHHLQIFLPLCRLAFHFVYGLLCSAKAVSLIRSHWFIFTSVTLGD